VRGYQLRHLSRFSKNYLLAGAAFVFALFASVADSEAAAALASAAIAFVAGVSINAPFALSVATFAFTSVAGAVDCSTLCSSTGASAFPLSTETFPLSAGIEINSALIMKTIAAAIVSFDRTDAVPRGPNAALETLLVNKAPASVLPGCRSTAVTSTKQATKKIVYKTYSNLLGPPLPPDGGNQNYL
jgi:hypothetical protein